MYFLKSVSWAEYLMFVVAASALFYAYVGLRYWRHELSAFLVGGFKKKVLTQDQKTTGTIMAAPRAKIMGPTRTVQSNQDARYENPFAPDAYKSDLVLTAEPFECDDEIELATSGEFLADLEETAYCPAVLDLVDQLNLEVSGGKASGTQLLVKIQELLSPHHMLASTPLRQGLNDLIVSKNGGQTITREQVDSLWDGFVFETLDEDEDAELLPEAQI